MIKFLQIVFTLLFLNIFSQNQQDAILGKWIAADKTVAVQVYRIGNDFKAKVIWFDENLGSKKPMHSRVDTANPDTSLRNRKIIGMDIMDGLSYNKSKERWENGKIYDASTGRTWDTYAELKQDGKLYVRGYWKFAWIGKSINFIKI